ncbi:hypothetical protein [Bradyrhizobium elkanii]
MNMFVSSAAVAAATPAIATASDPQPTGGTDASALWQERQIHIERLNHLVAASREAHEKLPNWAKTGPRSIDHEGKPCGEESNWPLHTDMSPPVDHPGVTRVVRPSIYEVREEFESWMRISGSPEHPFYAATRAKARANMRRRIRKIVARLRERERIYDELGLPSLDDQIEAECEAIRTTDAAMEALDQTPDAVAARLMARVDQDSFGNAPACGPGYDSAAAVAFIAIEALLPNLSGLIRDHAAFFVSNPYNPMSDMPWKAAAL